MARKTLYLLSILLAIIVGTILYYNYCSNCKVKAPINFNRPDSTANLPGNGFKLNADSLDYHCRSNFDFLKNRFNTLLPVSDSVNNGLDILKAYLLKNPNAKVQITGYAKSDEKNTSAYTSLGEARAVDVKNYIVSKGFTAKMFDTKGEITDPWTMRGDTVLGPVNFTISKADTATTIDWGGLKQKINSDPLVIHFKTDQYDTELTPEERQKVSDIVKYLGHVDASTISIVGHTDNVGTRQLNMRLGKERAEFAKNYFVKNGISGSKMKTSSKGFDEPIADNKTTEGRAKNRRAAVTIN
jgi:OOP family OmpA-OmpF porin